jgi:IS605 OrfB family transposase
MARSSKLLGKFTLQGGEREGQCNALGGLLAAQMAVNMYSMLLVYRYRVKSMDGLLNKQARAVNFVFNYCNDRQKDALRFGRKWLSGFDLNKLTTGSSKELGIHSGTINAVCEQYAKSRAQRKRPYLRYRGKMNLGWVPMKGRDLKETRDGFHFNGREFKVFKSRDIPEGASIKDGTNFSQDSRGNWFLNVCIEAPDGVPRPVENGIGIDLGLKDFAVLSDGQRIAAPGLYRDAEVALACAQRANKKKRVKAIAAKTANCRSDFLHKLSTRIVREFDLIAVGDVSAAGLARTNMAKSVLDASWSSFRNQLAYKAVKHGAWFEEVNESYTTQTCSDCGAKPDSRPRGIAGLGIRKWVCSDCGGSHDRDVNAAKNILSKFVSGSGHGTPVEGILAL